MVFLCFILKTFFKTGLSGLGHVKTSQLILGQRVHVGFVINVVSFFYFCFSFFFLPCFLKLPLKWNFRKRRKWCGNVYIFHWLVSGLD